MCKRWLILLTVVVLAAPAAQADIIHLKNGSILKGKVASFSDEQFVVMLDTGSGRYLSRAMVYVGDVARIEFEGAPAAAADLGKTDTSAADSTEPAANPAKVNDGPRDRIERPAASAADSSPRASVSVDSPRTSAADTPSRETGASSRDTAAPSRDTAAASDTPPDKPVADRPAAVDKPATSDSRPADIDRPANRRSGGMVRSATIDVIGKRDWTSTGMIVKRGDRIRINAEGTVTLDPVTGRTTGPEGIADLADPKKLMTDQATGALIGVIGADNDDFIFVGRSAEFTATRDGLLFLSVNEGTLSDNLGAFRAVIEVQAQRK